MTQARNTIVSVNDTPYYHCVSRCVRRAFLCGIDHYSGNDYEHRRDWVEKKLLDTAKVFALNLCAYAVMSNHYHVVIHLRPDIAQSWSQREVIERWHRLFNGTLFSQRYLAGDVLSKTDHAVLAKSVALWRSRLSDLSWFIRIVNEHIARKANKEDQCTGRFWEGRFKSQALLDERALLACMAYVDLKPIRAKMAKSPEDSNHTCVKNRIDSQQQNKPLSSSIECFVGSKPDAIGLPFLLDEYLELVGWTGRIFRKGKRGHIDTGLPPILERLSIESTAWKTLTTEFERHFRQWVGSDQIVRQLYQDKQYQRNPSTAHHRRLLS